MLSPVIVYRVWHAFTSYCVQSMACFHQLLCVIIVCHLVCTQISPAVDNLKTSISAIQVKCCNFGFQVLNIAALLLVCLS